jgi:hypothetical protein
MRFEVLAEMKICIVDFFVIAVHNPVGAYHCFGRMYIFVVEVGDRRTFR